MAGTSSKSPAIAINDDEDSMLMNDVDSICQEDDKTASENFKLTFYPDEADPLDRDKMQRIWNYIESESAFQKKMVADGMSKKVKATEYSARKSSMPEQNFDEKREDGMGIDKVAKNPEITPQTAIELLDHFRELHMVEDCLKKTEGWRSRSDCFHCSSESYRKNLDDIQSQIKHYEDKLVTQVIGDKRSKVSQLASKKQ